MIFLTKELIIQVNTRVILKENTDLIYQAGIVQNDTSLNYLADISSFTDLIKNKHAGKPDNFIVSDFAAQYYHKIIMNHIFLNGNKRTGHVCARYFIRINNYRFDPRPPNEDFISLAVELINHQINYEDIVNWFANRIKRQ